jgi:adenine-specific DNA-methyltransferase
LKGLKDTGNQEFKREMAKVDITKTELVWPGKYKEDGTRREVPRVNLPFQVIETINETRVSREAEKFKQLTLFDVWKGDTGETFESGWKNKLIWGDNLLVMGSLLEKFAGMIDLIYIDPPFATGVDFSFTAEIGDEDLGIIKKQSIIEEKAYRDTWTKGIESYLSMMHNRIVLVNELLSEDGTLYVHCDARMLHYLKVLFDEIFGRDKFMCQIIWKRMTSSRKARSNKWISVDDIILMYRKNGKKFEPQYLPYSEEYKKRFKDEDERGHYFWDNIGTYSQERLERLKAEGRIRFPENPNAKPRVKNYLEEGKGVLIDNIWTDISPINSQAIEDTGYDTQKPEELLQRIIQASSRPGDLIADFFCGSGTTLVVAEKLGRRWIGCDLGRFAIHVTRKRLLEVGGGKPFEILNLGKYERQYWQDMILEGAGNGMSEHTLFEYLSFILKLYGAQPVPGLMNLHGKRGKAMIHIGSVDAPVTIDEISASVDECAKLKQPELHILGWEWEMGLAGPNNDYKKGSLMHEVSKQKGVKLFLFQIPRDVMEQQAVDQGDIQFFELAYLDVEIDKPKKLTVAVSIKDFVIPNTELIPEEVREKISKWSDYIDYWALDWDFRNDTFIQGWVAYRTRQDRSLSLESDKHTYDRPGKYRILVKVVDIFGNDTSQAYDVQVV